MAKHSQAIARIKKNDSGGTGVPGHHMGRKEAEGPETRTEGKEEEQGQGVRTR